MSFPHSIQTDRGQPSKVRIGIIGADGSLTVQGVTYNSDSVGVLGSYMPAAGEAVAVLGQSAVGTSGSSWLILGATGSSSAPFADRITVTTAASNVTFTVPSGLRRVTIDWSARSDVAAASTAVRVRINNDSSANYHDERVEAVGAGAAGGVPNFVASAWIAGVLTGDTATGGFFSAGHMVLPAWDCPNGVSLSFLFQAASISSGGVANSGGGVYAGSPPFTSIVLFPDSGNWMPGSDFQLQGWPV